MSLSRNILNEIIDLLITKLISPEDFKALCFRALLDCRVLEKISYTGSRQLIATNLIEILVTHGECDGKPSVVLLLEELKKDVDVPTKDKIDSIVKNIIDASASMISYHIGARAFWTASGTREPTVMFETLVGYLGNDAECILIGSQVSDRLYALHPNTSDHSGYMKYMIAKKAKIWIAEQGYESNSDLYVVKPKLDTARKHLEVVGRLSTNGKLIGDIFIYEGYLGEPKGEVFEYTSPTTKITYVIHLKVWTEHTGEQKYKLLELVKKWVVDHETKSK